MINTANSHRPFANHLYIFWVF